MSQGYQMRPVRHKTAGADDNDPNTTPPTEFVDVQWTRPELEGLHARTQIRAKIEKGRVKLQFTAGNTCSVTVWHYDKTTQRWASEATRAGVAPDELYEINIDGGERLFFQITALTGGVPLDVYFVEV